MRGHLDLHSAKPRVLQSFFGHRRLDHPGSDGVAADAVRPVLAGDVGGQRGQPAFGRGVRAAAKPAHDGEGRRDVDDGRSGFHVRQHISREPKRRPQHHVEEVIQGLVVGAVQRRRVPHSGVVDQEVDPTPLLDGGLDNARGSVVIGQIDCHRRDSVGIAYCCGQFVESFLIPAGGEHGHAGFGELGRTSESDTTGRAGHDRYLHVIRPLLSGPLESGA